METQHTPGPWYVEDYVHQNPSDSHGDALAVWPCTVKPGEIGTPICLVSPKYAQDATDEANAKLIAAAPDLLAALLHAKEVIRVWHNQGHDNEESAGIWAIYNRMAPEMKPINEAIAKATQP